MRIVSAPCRSRYSSGLTTLPLLFDILAPLRMISPWARKRLYGSGSGTNPCSWSARMMKREYMRWSTACSLPPMYMSTGSQRKVRSWSKGRSWNSVDG